MATTARTAKTATTRTRKAAAPKPEAVQTPAVEDKKIRETKAHTADLTAPGKETERDFDALLEKDPTENATDFAAWFEAKSGRAVDPQVVSYVLATYQEFQASPEHKAKTQKRREAAAAKAAEAKAAKLERAKKQLAKLQDEIAKA